ncbi:uracil-DNA glycosylase [Sulfurihydrogenibium sp.]|uniref:uracil-DNA glycosylase n=1 Tax=Sulfurihydrogenibium sp. TaxID=2053621 RepID=UPI00260D3338|nr:uracil-DNA glycosylase [Sulfurihydrogenibium sp.]
MNLKDFLTVMKELGFDEIIIDNNTLNQKVKLLEEINKEIQVCTKCDLHKNRTQAVLGEGNPNSPIMFIGEAPGEEEDKQGRPFVGRAGQLLTKAIESAGYKRNDVYIANINKCRPPNNRTPTIEEQEACFPYLKRQIEIINPSVLCLLGATAYRGIFKKETKITKERGNVLEYDGKKVYVTYHPAYVLRNLKEEPTFFEDIKKALELAFKK